MMGTNIKMTTNNATTNIKRLAVVTAIVFIAAAAFLYSGLYPMGADKPHFQATTWILQTLREQSIARAASDVAVPENLNNSDRLLAGGADYNDMCSSCHLKPGKISSDFSLGLYPAPPNLALKENLNRYSDSEDAADKRRFWIIKHGIKASGMPAWAPGHDDERIWNMVAFLKRLPMLTANQYQVLTARTNNSAKHH
jgi:mono/diheme cytochrome c family protein